METKANTLIFGNTLKSVLDKSAIPTLTCYIDDLTPEYPSGSASTIYAYALNIDYLNIEDFEKKNLRIKKAIPFLITYENDSYILEQVELGVVEGSENYDDAKKQLTEYIVDDFLNWMETPQEELSEKAMLVKEKYQEYFELLPH